MGQDDAGGTVDDRHGEHAAALHRLAAMLVAGTDAATALTADALAARPGADRTTLRTEVVRAYLRAAPRRVERAETGTPDGPRDPGDVLRSLPPRARAASALSLVEGASDTEVAETVGVRRAKVVALVPTTPGVDVALTAVADRYALTGAALRDALGNVEVSASPRPATSHRRRRQGLAAAAAVALALAVGYALTSGDVLGTGDAVDEAGVEDAAVADPDGPDLTEAGWELTDEGEPPQGAMGLTLRESVEVDAGGTTDVTLAGQGSGASFAVLWCDMPPAQDANLETPRADVSTADGSSVEIPCAGREDGPPVSRIVALPPSGTAELQLRGDLPPGGGATLGVYAEAPSPINSPLPGGTDAEPPSAADGAVVLDDESADAPAQMGQQRLLQAVEIGADSTLRVWSGGRGTVSVQVDGLAATDDGDLQRYTSATGEVDWSTQRPDLRDGRWWVYAAGSELRVEIPEDARPPAGERREVVVEVVAEAPIDQVQVQVAEASQVEPDTAALDPVADTDAPELILGHRLVGQWDVPQDGQLRELGGLDPADPDEPAPMVLGVAAEGVDTFLPWSNGLVTQGPEVRYQDFAPDLDSALQNMGHGFSQAPEGAGGALSVAAPPAPGQPPATVLVYAPVPYGEFDFAAAQVPPQSWGPDEEPTSEYLFGSTPPETVAVLDEDDTEGRQVSVGLENRPPMIVRVTTSGRGRMQFLVDGTSATPQHPDGWWSSWTDQPVTTDVQLPNLMGGSGSTADQELTVVVEDYEDFTVEVLAP
ncbi:hypothetical protein ACI3EY_08865 [Ornithinimicrobium sp. LYQ92]|uniref:hypothetical protein n=1 Tax=Serinicoccus sp. LYQ92 TaxID=3378798 RepID=UPI003854CABE